MAGHKNIPYNKKRIILLLAAVICQTVGYASSRTGWQSQQVDWRITKGIRIKAVDYPAQKPLPILNSKEQYRPKVLSKEDLTSATPGELTLLAQGETSQVLAAIIDSPPIDGFVPWVVLIVTDKRGEELELDAVSTTSIVGNPPPGYNSQTDYVVAIFDTGASTNLMGHADAVQSGLFNGIPDLVTDNTIEITGVTGSVDVLVSEPLGIFIDGLGAIESNGQFVDTSGVIGETNVSILVGQYQPALPELPSAIGSPLSVYFTAVFDNEQYICLTHNSEQFVGPNISFFEHDDPQIPEYSQILPLELRPLGGVSVQYIPDLDIFDDLLEWPFDFNFKTPETPSVIIGNLSQSVFFVHSVDLMQGQNKALDKERFMFDTGAQVTVIGNRIGARLGLNPDNSDFKVKIEGVTGHITDVNGFYLDSLQIPALGEWLTFTNVPVILLDVASPEGGTVDGIIGMNLFTEFNFVFHGGGLFLQDDPRLELELISDKIKADIYPFYGDGMVNTLDLAAFAGAWQTTPIYATWYSKADLVSDAIINFLDFAVLSQHWQEGTSP